MLKPFTVTFVVVGFNALSEPDPSFLVMPITSRVPGAPVTFNTPLPRSLPPMVSVVLGVVTSIVELLRFLKPMSVEVLPPVYRNVPP
jgi:hypothetical protein